LVSDFAFVLVSRPHLAIRNCVGVHNGLLNSRKLKIKLITVRKSVRLWFVAFTLEAPIFTLKFQIFRISIIEIVAEHKTGKIALTKKPKRTIR